MRHPRPTPLLITPATERPVTIDAARKACHVEHTEDDSDIFAHIDAAVGWLQPPTGWLGRSLLEVTLRLDLPYWPAGSAFELPAGPVRALTSIVYFDAANSEQAVDPGSYFLDGDSVVLVTDFQQPTLYSRPGAVRILYTAGYEDSDALPATIKQAILQLVAHFYENRGDVSAELPETVQALLMPFKRWA